jgi:hypothetical protein
VKWFVLKKNIEVLYYYVYIENGKPDLLLTIFECVNIHTDREKTSTTSEYALNELCTRLVGCPWRATRKRARKSLHEHRMMSVVVVVVGRSFFFLLSLRHICLRVIIFLRPAMETHNILKGETETKGKKEKEYRDLFHPSAAFGTS